MRDISDVLKQKEAELKQVQAEIDALRIALRLLEADDHHGQSPLSATGTDSRVQEIKTGSAASRQFP